MKPRMTLLALAVVGLGAALGAVAASGQLNALSRLWAAPPAPAEPPHGDATVLPRPEPPFLGHIGRTIKDSTKDFPQEVHAPKGAPNVLLILTNDVGFGATQPFGGLIPTPAFDRLAKNGLRYTQFHTWRSVRPPAPAAHRRNHHSARRAASWKRAPGSQVTTR